MKKGEIYEGIVEKTEFPNRGIIRAEDRRIIIKNTLPGQKIRYRLKKLRKGTGEGQLLEVLEPSPLEVSPACPHFGQCSQPFLSMRLSILARSFTRFSS